MPLPTIDSTIQQEMAAVHRLYAALSAGLDPHSGLCGRLLFAGELDPEGCRLVRAANIAGAASLAATADAAAARQSIREGAVDFLVNSLDEALRILKNEIRKRQTVAVGVSQAPLELLKQMRERGVLPDLLPPSSWPVSAEPEIAAFLAQGARQMEAAPQSPEKTFLAFAIPEAWTGRQARFDAFLLEALPPGDHANRRWLRLSPRYLGPRARGLRSLECDADAASEWLDRVGTAIPG
jgi:urocanate hydratase